jgi:hypothetical protein
MEVTLGQESDVNEISNLFLVVRVVRFASNDPPFETEKPAIQNMTHCLSISYILGLDIMIGFSEIRRVRFFSLTILQLVLENESGHQKRTSRAEGGRGPCDLQTRRHCLV